MSNDTTNDSCPAGSQWPVSECAVWGWVFEAGGELEVGMNSEVACSEVAKSDSATASCDEAAAY